MAARDDVNPTGGHSPRCMDLRKPPVYADTSVLGRFHSKFFNDLLKRDNSRVATLTWSNKEVRPLYIPHKCLRP